MIFFGFERYDLLLSIYLISMINSIFRVSAFVCGRGHDLTFSSAHRSRSNQPHIALTLISNENHAAHTQPLISIKVPMCTNRGIHSKHQQTEFDSYDNHKIDGWVGPNYYRSGARLGSYPFHSFGHPNPSLQAKRVPLLLARRPKFRPWRPTLGCVTQARCLIIPADTRKTQEREVSQLTCCPEIVWLALAVDTSAG